MLTDKYATLDFRGLGYLRVNGRQGLVREVQQDGLAHLPLLHNQVISVVLYIYHTYARYLAVRYVIFLLLQKCVHGLRIFRFGLVGLRPTMMPVGGRLEGSLEAHVPPP